MSRYAVEQCAIAGRETRACREEEIFFSVPRFHKCCLHCEMMDASNEVHKMFRSMAVPIIFNNWRREKKRRKKNKNLSNQFLAGKVFSGCYIERNKEILR